MVMKICTACLENLPLAEFYVRKISNDGLTSNCKKCLSAKHKLKYAANRTELLQKAKTRYDEKRDSILAYQKQFYQNNAEKIKEYGRNYSSKNREVITEKRRTYHSNWSKKNAYKICEYTARRYIAKRKATLLNVELWKIREFYIQAEQLTKSTGIKHHVDHIVPIISKIVCGLHNHYNLQVITATENQIKSNHRWPDMP